MEEKKVPPTGYIRVHKHVLPENGTFYFDFTQWNGKRWVECVPKYEEIDELIANRMNSSEEIDNLY